MTNKKKSGERAGSDVTFEKALERLETIVQQMESADLPLEDVLKKYEEGTDLVKFCSAKLEEAEKKVEILSKRKDGSPHLKKFQVEDEDDGKPDESSEDKEKEGKLF